MLAADSANVTAGGVPSEEKTFNMNTIVIIIGIALLLWFLKKKRVI